MISFFTEAMSLPFMQRAVIVGAPISLCAAVLGLSMVLKRRSMIGDGLSHVGFASLAIASALRTSPMYLTFPVVAIASIVLLRISEKSKLQGDVYIALTATGSLAIGVLITSLSGTNADLNSYLFGSLLTIKESDVLFTVIACALVLVVFIAFFSRIFAVTFDETFARSTGVSVGIINAIIAVAAAIVIVLGMRMIGTLLISSLIVFPALTSSRIYKSFKAVTLSSAVISVVCFLIGIIASFALSIPAGASIVAVNLTLFCVISLLTLLQGRLAG